MPESKTNTFNHITSDLRRSILCLLASVVASGSRGRKSCCLLGSIGSRQMHNRSFQTQKNRIPSRELVPVQAEPVALPIHTTSQLDDTCLRLLEFKTRRGTMDKNKSTNFRNVGDVSPHMYDTTDKAPTCWPFVRQTTARRTVGRRSTSQTPRLVVMPAMIGCFCEGIVF